jgi:outer membrane protein assembly factor BamA
MKLPRIVQCVATVALLYLSQRPTDGQSQTPVVVPGGPSPTVTLETIDLKADAALEDVHPDHLTRSLTGRHWDDDDWVEELKQRIADAWQQLGYYKAEADVDAHRIRKSPQDRVYSATINVHAGRKYRLGDIHFVHAKQFTSDELRSLFLLDPGDVFDSHKVWQGFHGLKYVYGSRGFIKAIMIPETTIDEAHDRISLTIDVEEGPQFRLSEVKVLGLDPELAEKLLHDFGLRAGDIYQQTAVEDFFAKNKKVLPSGAEEGNQTFRQIDEQRLTVNLVFDFRNCNTSCD